MLNLFKKFWPLIILSFILTIIITLNFHPGKIVMGNDNFSPEINPTLTIKRSFLNPAWREYRVLGIPSDSEQGDVWRSFIFWFGNKILPTWMTSQVYVFATLVVGVISMGKVVQLLTKNSKSAQFFGSLLYLFSPITAWVYFYPVHLFVAAYAFTPLTLWMLFRVIIDPNWKNKILLLISSLIMGTTALTATMFITCFITIISVSLLAIISSKKMLHNWLIGMLIFTLPQLFWILPFTTYVKKNAQALQDSYINREITSSTIESEQTNNTIWNTLRFSSAWMDTKEDDLVYTYPARNWFKDNKLGISLGYIPAILALIGILSSVIQIKKKHDILLIGIVGFTGWILLSGSNPPFGSIYTFFDQNIPLFHQVFRWASSKFWPILFIPMIILASQGIECLLQLCRQNQTLKISLVMLIGLLLTSSAHPIVTDSLIRNEVFTTLPTSYSSLKTHIPDEVSTIDTTPHTNTRYFRKHDWGFWGSVFLNYLLPNPTTEKALIIGSYENESAFNALDESYYSENSSVYANALARYRTPYILSDISVTDSGLGSSYSFPYDFKLQDTMVHKNPDFTKIWSEGFLSLYKNQAKDNSKIVSISPNHNYEWLNKSLALSDTISDYFISSDQGSIYPLSQNKSEIILNRSSLLLSSEPGIYGEYNFRISQETLASTPFTAQSRDNKIIISPYFPQLLKNEDPIYYLPQSTYSLPSNLSLITIGEHVIQPVPYLVSSLDLMQAKIWTNSTTTELTSELKELPCNSDDSSPKNMLCHSAEFSIEESSIVKVSATFTASSDTLIDICLHSYLKNSCLNSPDTYTASDQPVVATILSNDIIAKNDHVIVMIVAKTVDGSSPKIQISNLSFTQSTQSDLFTISPPVNKNIDGSVTFHISDKITTSLPTISRSSSYQIFQSNCHDRGQLNDISRFSNKISFTTSNCFDGVYTIFSLPDNLKSTSLLTYVKADNLQGIPFEYNLKQVGVERKISTDLLPSKNNQDFLKLTMLPITNQNFKLELVNRGLGKNASINTLSEIVAIPMPASWLNLQLTPKEATPELHLSTLEPFIPNQSTGTYISNITVGENIYTLPTATSPYWKAVILDYKPTSIISLYAQVIFGKEVTQKTLVNGWQPAWQINGAENDDFLCVIFLPNVLAYIGLFIGMGIAFVLVAVIPTTKTASTHTRE